MKGNRSHIVLIGFMGSGKTTVGKLLADELSLPFLDLDTYIELQQGSTIKELFANHGESYFREVESRALTEVLSLPEKTIISTGGGAPCFHNNMNLINANALSIYLKVGSAKLVKRLKNDSQRPLLQNKTEAELLSFVKKTLRIREGFYMKAEIRVRAIDAPELLSERLTKYILKTDL